MRKMTFALLTVIVGAIVLTPALGWAANVPFKQRAVSPDKKWVAELKKMGRMEGKTTDWQLHISSQKLRRYEIVVGFQTQDVISEATWDDAWGIYDFVWSPDSRMILFVFRPYSSNSISHSNDCFGIFDIKTKQYEWVAGPVVDKMQSDYSGYGRPDFKLKWRDKNTVSFYMFKTTLHRLVGGDFQTVKVRPAGIRTVSVAKIYQGFARREQEVKTLVQQIIKAMRSSNWRARMKPLFADPKNAEELIERLAECQPEWKNAHSVEFISFSRRYEEFAIVIAGCFIVKNGRILDIPMDFD